MDIKVKSVSWQKIETDAIAIFAFEDTLEKDIAQTDKILSGLASYIKKDHFIPHPHKLYVFPTHGKIAAQTLVVVGLGKKNEANLETVRQAIAAFANWGSHHGKKSLAVDLNIDIKDQEVSSLFHAATEGVSLGSYIFSKYKSETKRVVADIVYLLTSASRLQHATNGVAKGKIFAEATVFTRDLVNEPSNVVTPTYLAQVAKSLAKRGEVSVEIMDEPAIKKMGMNAFLAVAKGSSEPPKLIKLTYKGGKKKVGLVGKAITFDTGGLTVKPWEHMQKMKLDMAGGATVLSIFKILPKLKPKLTVVGVIATCENMPGPSAMKPDDVVKAYNGKTIEIIHTDAEGRLTLADALSYIQKTEKPEKLIDIATLSGSCIVGLGEEVAGLFSNDRQLTDDIKKAALKTNEKIWELPLEKSYKELIESDVADLRNLAKNRYGEAITASLFLEEFIDKIPWAHIDIGGPAFAEKDTPLTPKGGSGFAVRTLLQFLLSF